MSHKLFKINDLDNRRRQLGLSCPLLARKSGVSLPTVQRIMSGKDRRPSFRNVMAVAEVLGFGLTEVVTPRCLLDAQAKLKAANLVRMVQGTSGLEGQAVDQSVLDDMMARTTHELLAGCRHTLWCD